MQRPPTSTNVCRGTRREQLLGIMLRPSKEDGGPNVDSLKPQAQATAYYFRTEVLIDGRLAATFDVIHLPQVPAFEELTVGDGFLHAEIVI